MAERKSSTSINVNSKGGAGKFTKQVQKKFSRAQEKVLQKFNRSEETRDAQFEICIQNFQDQQSDGQRIYKDLKAYLNAVRVMRDASSRLFQSLYDVYELDWDGGEELGPVVEGEELLWNDYEAKLRDQALLTMESYTSQFPEIRDRISKRSRKLVDYDSSRHQLESLQNAKKRDDVKIEKAEEAMKMTKTIFEDMNNGLKDELPHFYDSRVGCYATVFQAISRLREIFYKEMSQNNKDLQHIMMNLEAQHPDKRFVANTFNRGTLKRRSLKDALSPRSLRNSFSELHMSYSSRGSLRREHTSSFRSNRGPYESCSQEVLVSPTRPKPPKNTDCGVSYTEESSTSDHNLEVDRAHDHPTEGTKACESVATPAQQVTESDETAAKQVGETVDLDAKGDSSPEIVDGIKQDANQNHTEVSNGKVFNGDLEKHSTHREEVKEPGSGNGNVQANTEPEVSSKENAIDEEILHGNEEETF